MKTKLWFMITTLAQIAFLFLIGLGYLLSCTFQNGITYLLAVLINIVILFLPLEFACLIFNLIFLIKDIKRSSVCSTVLKAIISLALFVIILLLKINLFLSDSLTSIA